VTKAHGAGRHRGGFLGRVFLVLLVLLLLYLFLPFGSQRAVLLGSDARADEVSRSDTIVLVEACGGLLAVPRDTLVDLLGGEYRHRPAGVRDDGGVALAL